MREELRGAYHETADAIKSALRNRISLPVGTIVACVPFENRITRQVISELVQSGELHEYDNGDISLK